MHTIPHPQFNSYSESVSYEDRLETLSIKMLRVIKTLRLHADLAGGSGPREVMVDAETVGIAMDGMADDLDDARLTLLGLARPVGAQG